MTEIWTEIVSLAFLIPFSLLLQYRKIWNWYLMVMWTSVVIGFVVAWEAVVEIDWLEVDHDSV